MLSIYDSIDWLARGIKGRFSSLGYTKYTVTTALERYYSQKAMAARTNPAITQTDGSMVFYFQECSMASRVWPIPQVK